MQRTAVINVVGLTKGLIGKHTPRIKAFSDTTSIRSFTPAFPAVTCTAQSVYLTGKDAGSHGIVANGWYDREAAEVKFWKQSNHIVHGEKIWDQLRSESSDFTCAKMFWWYNMYSSADWAVTPRPMYPADGSKVFDIHTQPMGMRDSQSAQWIEEKEQPTLNLIYLPHLDYCLQQYGPDASEVIPELEAIDAVVGDLIGFFQQQDIEVVLLSEYGISKVDRAVHLNREFRKQGWIQIKDELGLETLDCGGSRVFAVADHQVAHIYVNDASIRDEVLDLLEKMDGVEEVRISSQSWAEGVATDRAGDFIAVAEADSWFTYYYWEDDSVAPDFARCVDIHRKPGYDPVELFLDPELPLPKAKIAAFLLKKKLGLKALLDVIPLDSNLVKGSHGRDNVPDSEQPVFIGKGAESVNVAEDVYQALLGNIR